MIRIVKENTVLASAFLIFIAVIKQILFYREFDIVIIDYLTFGEILTSIFDDIFSFLIVFGAILTQAVLANLFFHVGKLSKKKVIVEKIENKINSLDIDNRFIVMLVVTLALIISFRYYFALYNDIIIYIILLFVSQTVLVWFDFYYRNTVNRDSSSQDLVWSIFISFGVFVFMSSHFDVLRIKKEHMFTKIVSTDTLVCSNETKLLYIGKTENYFFTYDIITKTSRAAKMNDVKFIEQSK